MAALQVAMIVRQRVFPAAAAISLQVLRECGKRSWGETARSRAPTGT